MIFYHLLSMFIVFLFTISCLNSSRPFPKSRLSCYFAVHDGNLGATPNYLESSPSEEYQETLLASRNNVHMDDSNFLRSELYSKKSYTRLRKQRQSYSFGETPIYRPSTMINSTARSNSSFENLMLPLQIRKPWLRFYLEIAINYPLPLIFSIAHTI